MRIIAGKYKGHQLVAFKAGHIRPTTDRVKESVFNKLMPDILGARVLDLYAGTGNLSFESLSRGAEHVDIVEMNRKSLKIIEQNRTKLRISEGLKVYGRDVFSYIRSYQGLLYDIILVDPPFTEKIAHSTMEAIAENGERLIENGIVVIESSTQERIDYEYLGFYLLDRNSFGDKTVSFFKRDVI